MSGVWKLVVDSLVRSALNSAGSKIGDAIGARVGTKIKAKPTTNSPVTWQWTFAHNIALAFAARHGAQGDPATPPLRAVFGHETPSGAISIGAARK